MFAVSGDALPPEMHDGEAVRRLCAAVSGDPPVPRESTGIIPFHAAPHEKEVSGAVLRLWQPLSGSPDDPCRGLSLIIRSASPRSAFPAVVQKPEPVLRCCISLKRCQPEPFQGLAEVLSGTLTAAAHQAKHILRSGIASPCSLQAACRLQRGERSGMAAVHSRIMQASCNHTILRRGDPSVPPGNGERLCHQRAPWTAGALRCHTGCCGRVHQLFP